MADSATNKRSASEADRPTKRQKSNWVKQQGHQNARRKITRTVMENGNKGMFVTCDRGREGKAIAEVLDLLSQELPDRTPDAEQGDDPGHDDIEAQIKQEVEEMRPKRSSAPFQPVRLDVPCLFFVKINVDIDPVEIAHRLCLDAKANPERKRSRWVKRLIPITLLRKGLGGGFEELVREVLKPHFHSGGPAKKYAIRPSIRHSSEWNRDTVIRTIAGIVGPEHSVNLNNYDALILVDIVQNFCGMSVVGDDYDSLKKYNLTELYDPTPRRETEAT